MVWRLFDQRRSVGVEHRTNQPNQPHQQDHQFELRGRRQDLMKGMLFFKKREEGP